MVEYSGPSRYEVMLDTIVVMLFDAHAETYPDDECWVDVLRWTWADEGELRIEKINQIPF